MSGSCGNCKHYKGHGKCALGCKNCGAYSSENLCWEPDEEDEYDYGEDDEYDYDEDKEDE